MGNLVASFRFCVRGMSITESIDAATSQHHVTLSVVDPDGPDLRLTVTLDAADEFAALERAERIADAVYEGLLLDLSPHVAGAGRPVRERHAFTGPPAGATAVGLAVGMSVAIAEGRALLAPFLVKPTLDRILLGLDAIQPVIAADLYAARAMYVVAMQSPDPVASYLICYSALQLAALFKHGPSAKDQRDVDDLLIGEDSSIQRLPVTRSDGRVTQETPFTTTRNRFVHSEGRGKDPERAADEMRARLPAFRDLTARILRGL